MATAVANLISEEEYLRTTYHPDCDFVNGVVLERNLGQFDHSTLQTLLAMLFMNNKATWGVLGRVEQRLRVGTGKYRVPDLMALPLDYDRSQKIVAIAPLLCIEILSPDDTMPRIHQRCRDYYDLGVPETWIFDPETREVFIAKDRTVTQFTEDLLHCGKIEISCSALFAQADQA
jgi:Uma2 family endonuclease